MNIIIGNIVAFISSSIMIYTGLIKQKKKIIYVQSIQILLFALSNAILGGITGAITNIMNFIRNIICYKDKLTFSKKIILTIFTLILSLTFNNLGIIGYLPLIGSISYLWLMDIKNIINFKLLMIFTLILWVIYDIIIKSYVGAIFTIITIITNIISIYQIKNQNQYL